MTLLDFDHCNHRHSEQKERKATGKYAFDFMGTGTCGADGVQPMFSTRTFMFNVAGQHNSLRGSDIGTPYRYTLSHRY